MARDHSELKVGFFGAKNKALELHQQLMACGEENRRLRAELARTGALDAAQIQAHVDSKRAELAAIEQQHRTQASELGSRIAERQNHLANLEREIVRTTDEQALQTVGVYEYAHPLDGSVQYKGHLKMFQDQIKTMARSGDAIHATNQWTVNNSAAEGRRMVAQTSKLMLRAYNADADNLVRSMKPYKLSSATKRLEQTQATIQNLGTSMQIRINPAYHRLRIKELALTADYLNKVAEEKEAAREERARLAEEKRAQAEMERERKRLEKEQAHVQNALAALQAQGDIDGIARLQAQLDDVTRAIEDVDYRAANVRAGYVYVISNLGAFGPKMVKIGMTRRLEPMDRVNELGDASVPFRFDVHALFFSNDAVGIENQLHKKFADVRVNLVNQRREFFYATPAEVKEALTGLTGEILSYEESPPAVEYHQSHNQRERPAIQVTGA